MTRKRVSSSGKLVIVVSAAVSKKEPGPPRLQFLHVLHQQGVHLSVPELDKVR